MSKTTDKPEQKRWGLATWPAATFLLLILYPLSMGPAWWASEHFKLWAGYPLCADPRFTFYAPVFWACEACHPFGDALIWYVHLWADIAGEAIA